MVIGELHQLVGGSDELITLVCRQQIVIGVIRSLHMYYVGVAVSLVGGRHFGLVLHMVKNERITFCAITPHDAVTIHIGRDEQPERDAASRENFNLRAFGIIDGLHGRHNIQVEHTLADSSALVGILAGVGAAAGDGGDGDGTVLLPIVPQVVVCPPSGGTGI